MKEAVESARETFRKLAVFEIDPKHSATTHIDWVNASTLFESADTIDKIYWRQMLSDDNYQSLMQQIGKDDELKEMFLFYHGPYDQFNGNDPFLIVESRPPGAEFYPHDLTRNEFDEYLRAHQDLKPAFESPYTMIRRANGHLKAVPYHIAYQELVEHLSDLLDRASNVERHLGFAEFLNRRSKDLKTDDYYLSETLWVGLDDNPIDLAIGPYEVYDDQLMGLKAAFEAILFERDSEQSNRISHIQRELTSLCEPIERELGVSLDVEETNVKLSVGNLIYAGGEARNAVPAVAFSLPNDERVIKEVGSRQVILRNVLEAKFTLVAQRLAERILLNHEKSDETTFRDFLNHTLFHEISHSIGPKQITVRGEDTTVNRCLRQYHWVLEEAKADVLGACLTLTASKDLDPGLFLEGYIGHFLRSIRFGLADAHGGANAIQFNYLLRERAFTVNDSKRKISINASRAREAIFRLASEIISIQKCGDLRAAQRFIRQFCVVSRPIERLQEVVTDLPIDIRIRYRSWTHGDQEQSDILHKL